MPHFLHNNFILMNAFDYLSDPFVMDQMTDYGSVPFGYDD